MSAPGRNGDGPDLLGPADPVAWLKWRKQRDRQLADPPRNRGAKMLRERQAAVKGSS